MKINFIISVLLFFFPVIFFASETPYHLQKVYVDHKNMPSLQRGADMFMKNCLGCHSIKYVRYKGLAEGIGIIDNGIVDEEYIKNNWTFDPDTNINDNIVSSIDKNNALNWFGVLPPDLSLVAKYRGNDWIYTYLKSFYKDDNKTWGVNNLIFPDVAMPHVLNSIQGNQILVKDGEKYILQLVKNGSINVKDYDIVVTDIVNFLSYVSEPFKEKRETIGIYVVLFLIFFAILSYFLKKEYWNDIK